MTAAPLVTVVVPTHNSAGTIDRALASVAAQVGVVAETIVVDDCSTDDTAEVVRVRWPNVRLIQRPVNGRAGAARNDGIRAAQGTYLAFLDADDEWLPEKLQRQVETFGTFPNASIVATEADLIYGEQHVRFYSRFKLAEADEGADAWKVFLERNCVVTSSVMCRTEDARRFGGFREELHYGEDLDLWIKLATLGELRVVRDILVRWYFQGSGLSATQPQGDLTFVLPMISAHVEQMAGRLSATERTRILGMRNFDIAWGLYLGGNCTQAAPLFRKSFEVGWRRLASAAYLLDCRLGGPLRKLRG